MTVRFTWEHIFTSRHGAEALQVEFDTTTMTVVNARILKGGMLTPAEVADVQLGLLDNIDIAGGWDAFARQYITLLSL